jgi:hypothetical protein
VTADITVSRRGHDLTTTFSLNGMSVFTDAWRSYTPLQRRNIGFCESFLSIGLDACLTTRYRWHLLLQVRIGILQWCVHDSRSSKTSITNPFQVLLLLWPLIDSIR